MNQKLKEVRIMVSEVFIVDEDIAEYSDESPDMDVLVNLDLIT